MIRSLAWLLALATAAGACSGRQPTYEEEIAAWRAEKDRFMRSSESPVPPADRQAFAPLPYFPISHEYRVPAELEVVPGEDIIQMSTSTNQRRRMRRIGVLRFTLQGQTLSLAAYVDASENDMRRLFV